MARQLFIGLITEGPTDVRFLQSVVERTFIDVAFECENDLEPYVKCLTVEKVRLSFNESCCWRYSASSFCVSGELLSPYSIISLY